eukprot:11072071-Ditylum_brightwellii.AAC.1
MNTLLSSESLESRLMMPRIFLAVLAGWTSSGTDAKPFFENYSLISLSDDTPVQQSAFKRIL